MALLWLICSILFVLMAGVRTDIPGQMAIVGVSLAAFWLATRFKRSTTARLMAALVAVFVSMRYVVWRFSETIPMDDGFWSALFGIGLAAAEMYGIAIFLLGLFTTVRPLNRAVAPLPSDREAWPTVDVLVPTYNEPWSVVGPTLMAATRLAYPRHKLRVVCCDDGGTDQKRNDRDPRRAAAATARHLEFRRRCEEIGVDYITRPINEHAKAGNLNHALGLTSGDLILVLDADHVPTEDFLRKTVGQFLKDDKLFLVQTPHFFINPDPIEKNIGTFGRMPAENDLFYGTMQRGLDYWNASFFCGSAAVLRRSALMEIGGIQTATVTEDADTSLALHALGYTSAYIAEPLISGLQPASFVSLVKQRIRWAQGMFQILLLRNPVFRSGLTLAQRLCYLANIGFWTFPFARAVFIFTPPVFLVFGLSIYGAGVSEFLAYALPHLVMSMMLSHHLFGHERWSFASELYETALALFLLPALIKLIVAPRRANFVVTAKDEVTERAHLSPLAPTLMGVLAMLLVSIGSGFWRLSTEPLNGDAITIVLVWTSLNLLLVLGALGALYERPAAPGAPKAPVRINAAVTAGEQTAAATITAMSHEAAELRFEGGVLPPSGDLVRISVPRPDGPADILDARVCGKGRDTTSVLVSFLGIDLDQRMTAVMLAYGDSRTWKAMLEARTGRRSLFLNTSFVLTRCASRGLAALARAAGGRGRA